MIDYLLNRNLRRVLIHKTFRVLHVSPPRSPWRPFGIIILVIPSRKSFHLKLSSKSSKDKGQAKAATVVLETITYLGKTPAGKLSEEFTSPKLNDFLAAIEKFKLTPTEKLLLLNHCPRSAVEVQLLIEDSEERLR